MTAAKWWCPRHIVVTIEGPEGPRGEVVVTKPFARLGRDQRSEIELPDASVLPCHVYLHATNDGLYCAGFAAAGSLNGWLLPSATLEIGPFRVRASLGDAAAPLANQPDASGQADPQSKGSAGRRVPRIRMYTDKSRSSHADILLQRQLTLIGRQTPATWRIKHPTISRTHGAVVWDGAELWLIDFFSSNGTRLGESRCDASLVRVGEEFRIGTITCCYLDIQRPSAVTAPAGEQSTATTDSSEGHSTRRPADVEREPHRHDPGRERRVDAPQEPEERLAAPHAPGGGNFVRATPPAPPSVPASDRPAPEMSPAVLVETRPLTGDTKFVDRPQRSLEDRLVALEAELAAQRDVAAARAARNDAELLTLRQALDRLEATLRHERESDRDYRTQIAELRERVLRELAQIGEQTQLVRQACDARPWEGSVARLADDVARRCAELECRLGEGLQSAADKLAIVEGTMIAKMAELRSRQGSLGDERPAAGSDDPESVLSVEPLAEEWPAPDDLSSHDALSEPQRERGSAITNITEGTSTETAKRPPAASRRAATEGSSEWLLGEEFTHRLVDFQAKRERSAWQRRLLWTGAAVTLTLAIVLVAGVVRPWFNRDHGGQSGTSPNQPQEKAQPQGTSEPGAEEGN